MFVDFAPALVGYTDDVLFGDVWKGAALTPRDRSLVTVACLVTSGNTDQLVYHLGFAKDNGATVEELIAAITHLAFYAGWPRPWRPWRWPRRSSAATPDRARTTGPALAAFTERHVAVDIEPRKPTTKNPPEQFAGDVWLDSIAAPHNEDQRMGGQGAVRPGSPHRLALRMRAANDRSDADRERLTGILRCRCVDKCRAVFKPEVMTAIPSAGTGERR